MTHSIWEYLHKEAREIIDEYDARQKKAFAEDMKLGDFDPDAQDPFSNVYNTDLFDAEQSAQVGPADAASTVLQQDLAGGEAGLANDYNSSINTNVSPFDNMMMGDEEDA